MTEANDKRMQDLRQVETAEIEQLKREKQALVDELDASKWVYVQLQDFKGGSPLKVSKKIISIAVCSKGPPSGPIFRSGLEVPDH